ncbi:hypothetical protein HOG16_00255 [Candidatus Woesearchaeota archaeon]|nr:hypothetical protein [Candidatus Woesearchaeota archaeon]MBT4321852.1 hypothetical protein [Candidatus Woesearchaeota archaeon]
MLTMLELRRKVFHIFSGIVVIVLLSLNMITRFELLILLIVGLIISPLSKKYKIPIVSWGLKKMDRKKMFMPGWGAITALAGMLIALYLFSENIAYASILILSVGDGFAALIGKMGKMKTRFSKKKTWEGTISGIITATIAASFFVPLYMALVASMVAMYVELVDFKFKNIIDDNLLMPFIAGVIISLLML